MANGRRARNVKVHTQNVERMNGLLKAYLKRYNGIRSDFHEEALYEALFWVQNSKDNWQNAIGNLIMSRWD